MSRARDLADGTFSGAFSADSPTLVVDDVNNNVGIGTATPNSVTGFGGLTLDGTSGSLVDLEENGTLIGRLAVSGNQVDIHNKTNNPIAFIINDSEAAKFDASRNLLVGKTSDSFSTVGSSYRANGSISATATANEVLDLNRLSTDGGIMRFFKDSTLVGSIGTKSGSLLLGSIDTYLRINDPSDTIFPSDSAGNERDNVIDLGKSSSRFNDAFITNGVTTGSDANEKQQIAVLTDAEIAAAKRISAGFKTFKWNDAVEAKGDNARTHTGVIAQEVQAALEAEGLNAGNYAFWMSDTWWEADETYTDDDGVEQTRTNTYDTLEEAPAGATQRTRLGIRYPELLSFIGAATEQRLTSIEARLATLENA